MALLVRICSESDSELDVEDEEKDSRVDLVLEEKEEEGEEVGIVGAPSTLTVRCCSFDDELSKLSSCYLLGFHRTKYGMLNDYG